jgi:hypothetical protein
MTLLLKFIPPQQQNNPRTEHSDNAEPVHHPVKNKPAASFLPTLE